MHLEKQKRLLVQKMCFEIMDILTTKITIGLSVLMWVELIFIVKDLIYYACTRKYWRLCGKRAQNADFVFAICFRYIVGVFKPTRWYLTTSKEYEGRWEFEGEEIHDSPFVNMNIFHLNWSKSKSCNVY